MGFTDANTLRERLRTYDHYYYVLGTPLVSDAVYDSVFRQLVEAEAKDPDNIPADSPTQRVGSDITSFHPVTHVAPMLSIDNVTSIPALRKWFHRVLAEADRAHIPSGDVFYVVDHKIDGVSVSLRYEKGVLVRALTRGNGAEGDDITANARAIRSIPLRLASKEIPPVLEVRGEIYWPWASFKKFSDEFANPRNGTAGTIKCLSPSTVAKRGLAFLTHGVAEGRKDTMRGDSYFHLAAGLRNLGLPVAPLHRFQAEQAVEKYIGSFNPRDSKLPYLVDGAVVKVDSFRLRERMGSTSRSVNWAVAYKYPPEQKATELLSVSWQVGRGGNVTPVANLRPVKLAGSTVCRATLHNIDQIDSHQLRIGDHVLVEKAGEVIPYIAGVAKRAESGQPIRRPKNCPSCVTPLHLDGAFLKCTNSSCSAKAIQRIIYWCGKGQMNIEGLGPALIEQLYHEDLIADVPDLYSLKDAPRALAKLEGWGDGRIKRALSEISKSKKQPLSRVLASLAIPNIGHTTARDIAAKFRTMQDIVKASPIALQRIPGVGAVCARSLRHWLSNEKNQQLLRKLEVVGVNMVEPQIESVGEAFSGQVVVFTGELERYTRPAAQQEVVKRGGAFKSSVTRDTTLVVAGPGAGAKLDKARDAGIRVIDEAEFLKMLE